MKSYNDRSRKNISIFLSIFAFLWFLPFLYVVINSVKSRKEYNLGEFWDLPKSFSIVENFVYVNDRIDFMMGFLNSLFYGAIATTLAILFASLAAYAISSLKIKGKMFWFMLIYSGTIFPFQMYIIPIFRMYSNVDLYDTKIGLLVVYTALCIPFCLFVLRNYFYSIPKELVESAKMDGASDFKIYLSIFMRMAKAPIAACFLFQFTWVWNDLLFGLTLSKSAEARPIMSSLSLLNGAAGTNDVPSALLAAIIASIPTLFIFLILNKSFNYGFPTTSK
ncbi:carbohydrate ABC transporter permease [Oceanobacillus jordanicus]|uniref:Carbohydrate ABC transporter permease n=1 Tax=Oceanobacillus jordanicus TaxID=2867266 RepID=A0AAW5B0U5_9BACI|nr:carbohydrate ABC transporter permease [Oceanobacillus jordanicus]MCG3418171.1 carbohydrate ABC transporter permease [Oceanobacillus jordanicus]